MEKNRLSLYFDNYSSYNSQVIDHNDDDELGFTIANN
jgi:hypothetical protein